METTQIPRRTKNYNTSTTKTLLVNQWDDYTIIAEDLHYPIGFRNPLKLVNRSRLKIIIITMIHTGE